MVKRITMQILLLAAQTLAEVISEYIHRDVDLDYIQLRGIAEDKVLVANCRLSASTMYETVFINNRFHSQHRHWAIFVSAHPSLRLTI
jgi:hypothetical protein